MFNQDFIIDDMQVFLREIPAGNQNIENGKPSWKDGQLNPPNTSENAQSLGYPIQNTEFSYTNWLHITISGRGSFTAIRDGVEVDFPAFRPGYINCRDDGWAVTEHFDSKVLVYEEDYRCLCIVPTEKAVNRIIRYDYHKGTSFTTKKCSTGLPHAKLFRIQGESITVEIFDSNINNTFVEEEETIFVTMVRYD